MPVVKVALIGSGRRAANVVGCLLKAGKEQVEIASIYDTAQDEISYFKEKLNIPNAIPCNSSKAALTVPGVTWAMICTPNAFHRQYIEEAFSLGLNVFSEKPIATTIEDCQAIYDAHQKSGKLFATGFVLRYAPIYMRLKELLDSGEFGKIISINAHENIRPYHGGYIMSNWRRHTKISGPHILEKCCHDLDLINWFVNSHVSRGASFGGRNFFTPANKHYEDELGHEYFHIWRDPQAISSPFTDDTDLLDNQVSIYEYRNGVRVQFECTMSNPMAERRMYITLTGGNISVELYRGELRFQKLGDPVEHEEKFKVATHGGGNEIIAQALFDSMTRGVVPRCSGNEGLESAVVAIGLDISAHTGNYFNFEEVWKKLNR